MTRWFADTRVDILVAEDSTSLVRSQAEQGNMPPLHVHVDHDETFYVLDGRMSLHLPGRTLELGPTDSAFAPRGVPHAYRVDSSGGATWLVSTTTRGFADFVEETSVPAESDGYAPVELIAAPELLASVAARNGIEILGPPGAMPA